jgi:TRAP-type C4-dicarboxylate transport system permease small subunit
LTKLNEIGWFLLAVGILLIVGGLVLICAEGAFRFVNGQEPTWTPMSYAVIATIVGIVFAVTGTFAIKPN